MSSSPSRSSGGRGRGRKRGSKLAAGGGVLLLMGLLGWQMGLFGPGAGSGEGDGKSDDSSTVASTDPASSLSTTSPKKRTTSGPADTITVVIDGREYKVVVSVGDQPVKRPIELDDIVRQAQEVPGNIDGVKVRILRMESSRVKAEKELLAALETVGISGQAIFMPDQFLDEQ